VDAGRQLEVAADLFRKGRMPELGVDILDAVAAEYSYQKVAEELGLTASTVRGRVRAMRNRFREAIVERGMVDDDGSG
jgi:DNA-directed RNA polymerase specialized sigma24 family protein